MALQLRAGPWAAFHGLPTACVLSFQAEEGRPAPKAKVAKIIKEAILLFSDHHPSLFPNKIPIFLTLFAH